MSFVDVVRVMTNRPDVRVVVGVQVRIRDMGKGKGTGVLVGEGLHRYS